MSDPITSPSNPLLKQVRLLRQKKGREQTKLFLVEGILHIGEAAEAGWDIRTLLYCPERLRSEFGQNLVERLSEKGVRCVPVAEKAFQTISEKENPQGIIALVYQRYRTLSEFPPFSFIVALVSPQDPGNVGTILRTIDGAGADGLLLLEGGADPYHPSCVRASMGTLFWKPFAAATFDEFVDWARQRNCRILGTSAQGNIHPEQVNLDSRPTILLLGSEQKGLMPEHMAICDRILSLPMRGRATSLNLAVAAGIFLYALSSTRKE
ncbi:MAG: RNA methyltransferase [Anaerolineales bacterium]|nr:RNA methyltransferase [Anaerolineales bacterium]MDW8227612.1 RNA methyltransferase [Anaerolineales bacterium]